MPLGRTNLWPKVTNLLESTGDTARVKTNRVIALHPTGRVKNGSHLNPIPRESLQAPANTLTEEDA